MRCPKCHYVSFDGQQRCRNCGYDLSLSPAATTSGGGASSSSGAGPLGSRPLGSSTEPLDVSTRPGNPQASTFADLELRHDPETASGSSGLNESNVVDAALGAAVAAGTGGARGSASSAPNASSPDFRIGAANARGAAAGGGSAYASGAGASSSSSSPAGVPGSFGAASASGASANANPGPTNPGAARARRQERPDRADVDPLDLPLFDPGPAASSSALDRPLIASASPPRAPLAVRRATPEIPRLRGRVTPPSMTPTRIEEPTLDLDVPDRLPEPDLADDTPSGGLRLRGASGAGTAMGLGAGSGPGLSAGAGAGASSSARGRSLDPDDASTDTGEIGTRGTRLTPPRVNRPIGRDASSSLTARDGGAASETDSGAMSAADADVDTSIAPLGTRAVAALIDLAFLAIVDFTVMHFTLRLTGLTMAEIDRLPIAPLAGFLALLNGGYLTMFTAASGQTMGKMVTGLKVVPSSYAAVGTAAFNASAAESAAVPFGHAVLRAILWLLTIVPFGIGALPALLTDDRRALHDRLADTRVIKVE